MAKNIFDWIKREHKHAQRERKQQLDKEYCFDSNQQRENDIEESKRETQSRTEAERER